MTSRTIQPRQGVSFCQTSSDRSASCAVEVLLFGDEVVDELLVGVGHGLLSDLAEPVRHCLAAWQQSRSVLLWRPCWTQRDTRSKRG